MSPRAADYLVLVFLGYVLGGALATAMLYLLAPIAKTRIRAHVFLLAYAFSVFVSAPALHSVGIWGHQEDAFGIHHFGELGGLVMLSAAIASAAGISIAISSVALRLCNSAKEEK